MGVGRTHKAKLFEAPSYAINPAKTPLSQRFNFHVLTVDVRGDHQTKGDKIQIGQMFLSNASGGQNQKGPTNGQGGYVTPAAWGVATALERGAKSEVAHLWARWLRNLCRLGGPHRF